MTRTEESKETYQRIKQSLFKAYAFFENHDKENLPFDLFEFQFFDKETYDDFFFECDPKKYSEKNRYLYRVGRSRFNFDLVYQPQRPSLFNMGTYIGLADYVNRLEYYFDYLRSLNERYLDGLVDLGIYNYIEPFHVVDTNITANDVKDTIDLAVHDNVIGIRYRELYQYEDIGMLATEHYLYEYVDTIFGKISRDLDRFRVTLTDDYVMTIRVQSN
jgi:hypothetical protein